MLIYYVGKCRLFLATSPGVKLPIPIPKWFIHSFVNGFLDMDLWLHDQERNVRLNNKLNQVGNELNQYVLPTKSDYGVNFFRLVFNFSFHIFTF